MTLTLTLTPTLIPKLILSLALAGILFFNPNLNISLKTHQSTPYVPWLRQTT